ncbi:MAG: ABC transporter ATP-binding protein [Lachnospiraceae bacterium]|nr:ABC transporter ATP-binding protein [Lachnospiraceae bacterium]
MSEFITFDNVTKEYSMGEVKIRAVDGASFTIAKGEFVVIVGPSGAGKTTILNMLGGMDACTSGTIIVNGREISRYDRRQLTRYRREEIGFVFQFYNLVQNLTAIENVELAAQICRDPLDAAQTVADVGLADRMNNFPGQLSGGEQQRIAIARAIAKNPALLLCDEPTGALDYITGKQILSLLWDMCRKRGMTVIVITHNLALTPMADRVIHIRNGKAAGVEQNANPVPVEEIEW